MTVSSMVQCATTGLVWLSRVTRTPPEAESEGARHRVDDVIDRYELPRTPLLSRWTVDRGAAFRADAQWVDAAWSNADTRIIAVGGGRVAMDTHGLAWRSPRDGVPDGERLLLGVDGGVALGAVCVAEPPENGGGLREIAATLSERDAGLAVEAVALASWHATHQHCPRCGHRTVISEGGWSRRCLYDDTLHYPRTDPAVIMLVVDEDDRCLLGHAASWPDRRYSTLAGFVEPGETPDRAVAREVAEEAGVVVDRSRYVGAQPWPFPASLMLGYYASAAPQIARPDGTEIQDVRWFSRDEFTEALTAEEVLVPSSISIASLLIEGWYGKPLPSTGTFR